jgi:opacity protein-like surface antigen
MKKCLPVLIATFSAAVSLPTLANPANVEGHRIGAGFSKTKDVTAGFDLGLGGGLKLEYGYELNHVFGFNVSYQGFGESWGDAKVDGSVFKADTDIGYAFDLQEFSIKPYVALGLAQVNEKWSIDGVPGSGDLSDTSFLFGFGARATFMHNFYADMRFDYLMTEYSDLDQFSMSFGYKF